MSFGGNYSVHLKGLEVAIINLQNEVSTARAENSKLQTELQYLTFKVGDLRRKEKLGEFSPSATTSHIPLYRVVCTLCKTSVDLDRGAFESHEDSNSYGSDYAGGCAPVSSWVTANCPFCHKEMSLTGWFDKLCNEGKIRLIKE